MDAMSVDYFAQINEAGRGRKRGAKMSVRLIACSEVKGCD